MNSHLHNNYHAYYEIDTPIVAAHQWPAHVIELASARDCAEHQLLRNTGIFREDLARESLLLTPLQCFQLIQNIERYADCKDISFLTGHKLFPGHYGAASNLLIHSQHLQHLLDLLVQYQRLLNPLLHLEFQYQQDRLFLYWRDACGANTQLRFLSELFCAGLHSFCRWLSGHHFDWHFYFAHSEPVYPAEYQVHLGDNLHFNSPVNAISIAREQLYAIWPKASTNSAAIACRDAQRELENIEKPSAFLSLVYAYLRENIHTNPHLEQTALAFCMSSASFKRKLQKHHTHFQAQYDQVRKDLALYWLHTQALSNEALAQKLHFYDAANLRRAFKKWTGVTPTKTRLLKTGP